MRIGIQYNWYRPWTLQLISHQATLPGVSPTVIFFGQTSSFAPGIEFHVFCSKPLRTGALKIVLLWRRLLIFSWITDGLCSNLRRVQSFFHSLFIQFVCVCILANIWHLKPFSLACYILIMPQRMLHFDREVYILLVLVKRHSNFHRCDVSHAAAKLRPCVQQHKLGRFLAKARRP